VKERFCDECHPLVRRGCPTTLRLIGEVTCEFLEIADRMSDAQLKDFILERLKDKPNASRKTNH
jgi:hypothetical protein